MAIPDPIDPKSRLRETIRRNLHAHTQDSQQVCEEIDRWLAKRPELATIAAFSAIRGEVDLSELVASHPERTWVFPRVTGHELTFHPVKNPARELIRGAFGILEPSPTLTIVPAEAIDAFLCPGLAFDSQGGRLGRGRGFYDRMLTSSRDDAVKIGVCFPHQIVPDTFMESHDIHMDELLSENIERKPSDFDVP